HLYHSRMGFFFHHLRGETKKVIIRLPLGSFRRFQLKSMNYSGLIALVKNDTTILYLIPYIFLLYDLSN
ncbi:hypothetical protein, partial [Enterococcus faecalis]|uniref:hypothetical protein n=1 Tax=Enterococcus faecalis TaxID=1351 RepID=UPI0030C7E83D